MFFLSVDTPTENTVNELKFDVNLKGTGLFSSSKTIVFCFVLFFGGEGFLLLYSLFFCIILFICWLILLKK